MKNSFISQAANCNNPKWNYIISRSAPLYKRPQDIRSEFERDYDRVIHTNAYRRLKHKTQVFFSPQNDHICTRSEHVNIVECISYTIAHCLGLNVELTKAISLAHDIGHSPFGHRGEKILSDICVRDLGCTFWHEQNGLYLVDNIELLEDYEGCLQNLNLTYAVRDGIISHCGEIDENSLRPRDEFIDLEKYSHPNQYSPYTWEGCVVKIADKISYIGMDIQDAISLGILDEHLSELYNLLDLPQDSKVKINNTYIVNQLISDLCENSSIQKGLCFSDNAFSLLNNIKDFNYKNIYLCKKVNSSIHYFSLIINQIYDILFENFDGINTFNKLDSLRKFYPTLVNSFTDWLMQYLIIRNQDLFKNKILYDIENKKDYSRAIIEYISGMTDKFAIDIYNEIIGF